jgi:hypothetical protein
MLDLLRCLSRAPSHPFPRGFQAIHCYSKKKQVSFLLENLERRCQSEKRESEQRHV